MPMRPCSHPSELIQKLLKEGPHKSEPTPRRVRGILNGKYIFDTTHAVYVWEHPWYPQYYIPKSDFAKEYFQYRDNPNTEATFSTPQFGHVKVGDESISVIGFEGPSSPLHNLVRVAFASIDAWFAEETQIYAHPKDPYKRIECLPSSRTVRIEVSGTVVAESSNNVFLYETGLRPRYYLAPTCVKDWAWIEASETESYCPYKGMANYYHLKVGDKEIKDAIWWYKYPTPESHEIAGRLCFYNEKVDVFIDGVKEESTKSEGTSGKLQSQ